VKKGKKRSVWLPEGVPEALDKKAAKEERSINAVIVRALKKYLGISLRGGKQ